MVKLRIGGNEYPLALTVLLLKRLEGKGQSLDTMLDRISPAKMSFSEALGNAMELLGDLAAAGASQVAALDGASYDAPPTAELLAAALTPGEVFGLCDAAIMDGLERRVQACYEKNGESVAGG